MRRLRRSEIQYDSSKMLWVGYLHPGAVLLAVMRRWPICELLLRDSYGVEAEEMLLVSQIRPLPSDCAVGSVQVCISEVLVSLFDLYGI